MKKATSIVCALAFCSSLVRGQEMHFSQYNENPALLNPALTGLVPFRASICYRDQWRSLGVPYKTFGVNFETRFRSSEWEQVDKFRGMTFKERTMGRMAWGLSVHNDKAGPSGLAITRGCGNLATFIPLSRKSFVSAGLQAVLVQRKIENGRFVFPSQYNGSTYDPYQNSGEKFSDNYFTYADFAAGINWSYGVKEKKIADNSLFKANAGASLYHILKPRQEFLLQGNRLAMKYQAHADVLYEPGGTNFGILPSVIFQRQGSSSLILAGLQVKYFLKDNSVYTGLVKRNAVGMGLAMRGNDAVIFNGIIEIKEQYFFGLSYDVTVSQLAVSNKGRGAFELCLRYTPPAAFLYEKRPVTNKD